MASVDTVGRRVRTAGRFVVEASYTLLLTVKTPLVRRKLSFQSPTVALVPIGAAAPLSSPDSSAGATTLARKVPRRALGSWGRINAAAISGAGSYRYRLVRVWNSAEPLLGWVILNPSTPDGRRGDPTVQRCMALSRAWGYGGVVIRNLYGLVSTDSATLSRHRDPVGPRTDSELASCWEQDATVLAWGAAADPDRARQVAGMLRRAAIKHGRSLAVLGWTARQPCLPLDVPTDTTLQCFTLEGFDDIGWAVNEIGDLHWAQLIGGAA
jgi:hypothetical protein